MLKRSIIAAAMLVGVALISGQARTLDLGLTLNHAFALRGKINNGLLAIARVMSDDLSWHDTLSSTSPGKYEGRKPSDVLVNSGHVLDGLAAWLIRDTKSEQLISQFYTHNDFHDKTQSDVYGLVDLASRRLDLILSKVAGSRGISCEITFSSVG